MHYIALATDYDGTIAVLQRLKGVSRHPILVTGRELDDLIRAMPRLDLFDVVVAENGAVLYWPATKRERTLATPPPPEFAQRLRELGVSPRSVGRVIVASWEPSAHRARHHPRAWPRVADHLQQRRRDGASCQYQQ